MMQVKRALVKGWLGLLVVGFLCVDAGLARAGTKRNGEIELRFDPQTVQFERIGQFERVFMPGLEEVALPGEPGLPAKVIRVLIPGRWRKVKVEAVASEVIDLGEGHRVFPRQTPQVLSIAGRPAPAPRFVSGKETIYESNAPFPGQAVKVVGTRVLADGTLATVVVYPLRYFPKSGRLELSRRVRLRLSGEVLASAEEGWGSVGVAADLHELVDYDLMGAGLKQTVAAGARELPRAQYVVVTSSWLARAFEPLVRWKNEKGVTAEVVTLDWIYRHFSGVDEAEQVREFLKYAHRRWGTRWVLLGGDTDVVPMRYAYAMDCQANYAENENNIPCDLYFADLDGNWNADGDDRFGEVEDQVQGYADLFVGRAPVETEEEVQTFVWKSTVYELSPSLDNILKMLFLGEVLWNNPYTDSGEGKNLIDLLYVPERFDPITKLYESLGNESVESVLDALNSGYNFVNHDGHAWYTVMGVGQGYLKRSDVWGLENGERLPLVYSIGCWPAAFDLECIAEDFVNNPNGGAVAFIGNSRYGWGSPGNPHFGYSDRFDQQFYRMVFQENVHEVGRALALAKAVYVPFAQQENVYRWCEYEINLLGDPELSLWTDVPAELTVQYPDSISRTAATVEVVVSSDGRACPGARVAVSQDGHLRGVATTDAAGFAVVPVDSLEPGVDAKLVVTGPNLLPFEGTIHVRSAVAYLSVFSRQVVDEQDDGFLNPGLTSEIRFQVRNAGETTSTQGTATLTCDCPWLSVQVSSAQVPALSQGDSVWIGPFVVAVDDTVADGAVARMKLNLPDHAATVSVGVGVPRLDVAFYAVQGSDHRIAPGEEGAFVFGVTNEGLGAACGLSARFRSLSAGLWAGESPISGPSQTCLRFGEMYSVSADARVDSSVSAPWFPKVEVTLEANDGRCFVRDTVQVTVGKTGFADSCEAFDRWDVGLSCLDTLAWQVSDTRYFSPPAAFYCGNGRTHKYVPDMEDSLVTLPFVVGQEAKLEFWCWYDVAIYGVDGLYVRVQLPDGSWKTLDFIGSGGALPGRLMGNDWLLYRYDLGFLPPGTRTRLCFKFVSDDDTEAEGVYIDDIVVMSEVEMGIIDDVTSEKQGETPGVFELLPPYPNPFNSAVQLAFVVPERARVEVAVFDLLGRQVADVYNGWADRGRHLVRWHGLERLGRPLPSGVYIVRAWSEDTGWVATRKLVLLR